MTTHLITPDPPEKGCYTCEAPTRKKNSSYCQPCWNARERRSWNNKPVWWRQEKWLKRKYKKDYNWYRETWEGQDKKCAICKDEIHLRTEDSKSKACVDHDHETGEVRGLLCNHCNRAIGLFKEDKEVITNALSYIKEYL